MDNSINSELLNSIKENNPEIYSKLLEIQSQKFEVVKTGRVFKTTDSVNDNLPNSNLINLLNQYHI